MAELIIPTSSTPFVVTPAPQVLPQPTMPSPQLFLAAVIWLYGTVDEDDLFPHVEIDDELLVDIAHQLFHGELDFTTELNTDTKKWRISAVTSKGS